MSVKIIDLKPTGQYADGSSSYSFHTSFPTRNVMKLEKPFNTPLGAQEHGKAFVAEYERVQFPGGMGECCGVVQDGDTFYAVVNTYWSNS